MKKKKHDTHFLHIHEKMMTTSYAVVYTEKIYVYKCVQFLGRKKKHLWSSLSKMHTKKCTVNVFLPGLKGGIKRSCCVEREEHKTCRRYIYKHQQIYIDIYTEQTYMIIYTAATYTCRPRVSPVVADTPGQGVGRGPPLVRVVGGVVVERRPVGRLQEG